MMMTRSLVSVLSSFLLAAVPGVFADDKCKTIYEIVCETENLENFCGLIGATELDNVFDQEDDLTVFAPVNSAVQKMGSLDALLDEELRELVLFHVYDEALLTDNMRCEAGRNRLRMESGKDSRTICENYVPTFQKGGGNSDAKKPVILSTDINACNGVIHTLDTVMLPGGFEEYEESSENKSENNSGNEGSSATYLQRSSWYALAAIVLLTSL